LRGKAGECGKIRIGARKAHAFGVVVKKTMAVLAMGGETPGKKRCKNNNDRDTRGDGIRILESDLGKEKDRFNIGGVNLKKNDRGWARKAGCSVGPGKRSKKRELCLVLP